MLRIRMLDNVSNMKHLLFLMRINIEGFRFGFDFVMAAPVDETKELGEQNVKLGVAAEAGDKVDLPGSGDHVKETKKGLFGRSAEFLKASEASTLEATAVNGNNGEVVEEISKKNVEDGNEGNVNSETCSNEKAEEELHNEAKSLAEEIAACEANETKNTEPEIALSHEKCSANTDEAVNEDDSMEKNNKKDVAEVLEKNNDELEEKEKAEDCAKSSIEDTVKEKEEEHKSDDEKESDVANSTTPIADKDNKPEANELTESSVKKRKRARSKVIQQEEPMNERRRSLRTPKPTSVSVPIKAATEKPVRKTAMKSEKQVVNETPTKNDSKRKDEKAIETTPKRAVASSKQGSSRKSKQSDIEKKDKSIGKEQASDSNDPFNLSNIDNHPVILGNIQIHTAQFGSLKFTKASPGSSQDFDAAGRYGVTFVQDNLFRKLVITGIIPLQAIVPGVKVYATDPEIPENDARLEEVEVLSVPDSDHQKWFEGIFRVKICESGKQFNIKWDRLCFGIDEAKTLQTAKFNSVTDVIADNIDSKEGRKTRASRHSFAPETALSPSVAKQTPRKRAAANRSDKRSDPSTAVEIGVNEKQAKHSKAGTSGIFAGVSFVVTSAMRRLKEEDQGGFSKREIRQMIEGCGGTVVEDFTKIPSGVQMFLIADTHYRTHKYLSALARSVPCVSHRWIRECVEKGEMIDYKPHMLPAGISLLTNKLTNWHQNNNTLLSGKRIFVYTRNTLSDSSSPNFIEIWSPLVAEMGATVLNEIPGEGIDILLTDATCPNDLVQKARRCNALVVSSEWIIQAIIEGSLPDPNAHERFRYDFIERLEGA
uniref:BRCT domain-containing protein n=1 Tax=Syphacia muris TaxID=451379 RepID=A0A0N5AVB3_9BILA